MNWVLLRIRKAGSFLSPSSSPQTDSFDLNSKISPSVLLTIIVLAFIFFVSGLLHLLIRFLLRPRLRLPQGSEESATALQGRLQTLFHLHDSGVDQSFIDALPIFHYKTIIGRKQDPFDCAVCLCEFDAEDELRLLPKCSHAFHVDCIDTWLLTHSTCPLCRANLLVDVATSCSPVVLVLESGSESSREIPAENGNMGRSDSHPGSTRFDVGRGSGEHSRRNDECKTEGEERVVPVKLGKFKNIDACEGNSSSNNGDGRRCVSMGSFEYVMPSEASLQVHVTMKKTMRPPGPCQRPVCISGESRRAFPFGHEDVKESFSVSKIWLRGAKEMAHCEEEGGSSGRRAFSFRFPDGRDQSFTMRNVFWSVWRQNKVASSSSLASE